MSIVAFINQSETCKYEIKYPKLEHEDIKHEDKTRRKYFIIKDITKLTDILIKL